MQIYNSVPKSFEFIEDGVKICRLILLFKYYFTSRAALPSWGVIVTAVLFVFTALFATPALAQSTGVCGRTAEVRDALLARVQVDAAAVTDCSLVTTAHLEALTGTVDLSSMRITGLESGDFAGLTNLTSLYLDDNDLQTLPDGVFGGLASLDFLLLDNNDLETLPNGVFGGLASLDFLLLDNNDLQTLPDGVFGGLASLDFLLLNDNDLQTLPDGVFGGLASLSELYLHNNPGTASFLPTADAGADQMAELGATVSLDGSASSGGPWGTNITYAWAVADGRGNPVTDLTLTGGDTATPSFVVPGTAPAGGLVFTLTVQGKGHRGLNLYKSTDSVAVETPPGGDLRRARLGPDERHELPSRREHRGGGHLRRARDGRHLGRYAGDRAHCRDDREDRRIPARLG